MKQIELQKCMPFYDMEEFVNRVSKTRTVWSWGAKAWTCIQDKILRFEVSGHHFKGLIHIVVNYKDLFDIYYTDKSGTIKHCENDIHVEDILGTIDKKIEYIAEYKS